MSNEMTRMSKSDKQRALVPRLRFPEFTDSSNWTNLPVGTVLSVRDDRQVPTEDVPLYSLTIENGVTAKSDRYNREFLVQNGKKKYKVVRPGDIVYNPANLRWGAISRSAQSHSVVVSPIYEVLYVADSSLYVSEYADYAITRPEQITLFAEKGQGTLVERIAVNVDDFLDTPLPVPPSPNEQWKIADCLGSLDNLIAAEGRKLAALRDHKKGLMQQLFPREGETRPRLRFPEFQDDGRSGFKPIGEFAKVTTGDKDTQNKVGDGEYPFFVRSQNVERIDSFSHDGEAVLTSGDGVGVGENYHYINGKFDFHQRVYCIYDFDDGTSGRFFFHYFSTHFKKRVKQMSAKNSVDSVRRSMITEMPTWMPDPAEQQRIADCLSSLDSLIVAQAEKLDALRTHRRGLMQQLFPSPEDVGV